MLVSRLEKSLFLGRNLMLFRLRQFFTYFVNTGNEYIYLAHTVAMLIDRFDGSNILDLIGKLTANTNNTTLKTIGNLAGQYDGLKIGLELQK